MVRRMPAGRVHQKPKKQRPERAPKKSKAEAAQESVKAREALRDHVAALAVRGAEQILRKEVNPSVHAELLGRLKTEL